MEKYESIPLELSNVYIEASAGFSLDIGQISTVGILYTFPWDKYQDTGFNP